MSETVVAYDLGRAATKHRSTTAKETFSRPRSYPTIRPIRKPGGTNNGPTLGGTRWCKAPAGSWPTARSIRPASAAWPSRDTAWVAFRSTRPAGCCATRRPSGPTNDRSNKARRFFNKVDPDAWYRATGNGFPAAHYTAFKLLWYRDHEPRMFDQIDKVIGTKDYVNYRLTGHVATDYSYASGSGVYDLMGWDYSDKLLAAADLPRDVFPDIVPSTEIIGQLTPRAADALGLPVGTPVACGGVDNSCMALGARAMAEGRAYASLGSSMWIAVSSGRPLLNDTAKPYVFTHVVPGMFTLGRVDLLGRILLALGSRHALQKPNRTGPRRRPRPLRSDDRPGRAIADRREQTSLQPSLAGGSSLEPSAHIRGALLGLDLGHAQSDIIRAALEGIALNLRLALDELRPLCRLADEMVVVGGCSRSSLWRQIFADALELNILKTNVGQEAGSLGAAAVALVASGVWPDFNPIDNLHQHEAVAHPQERASTSTANFSPFSTRPVSPNRS